MKIHTIPPRLSYRKKLSDLDQNLAHLVNHTEDEKSSQITEFVEKRKIFLEPTVEKELKGEIKHRLKEGFPYLIKEETPEKRFDIFTDYITHGIFGLCITRTTPRFLMPCKRE